MRFLELKIPPVAVVLLCGAAMWFTAARVPEPGFAFPGQRIVAGLLFIAGLAIGIRGVIAFRRHKTTVNPTTPGKASTVVTSDVFARTRNPMYLGLAIVLVAWTVFLGSLAAAVGIPVFVAYMTRFQIMPEERALAGLFGAPYDDYRRRVRRWI